MAAHSISAMAAITGDHRPSHTALSRTNWQPRAAVGIALSQIGQSHICEGFVTYTEVFIIWSWEGFRWIDLGEAWIRMVELDGKSVTKETPKSFLPKNM
jgi:hypothetical protein